jgi:hypothetical protein
MRPQSGSRSLQRLCLACRRTVLSHTQPLPRTFSTSVPRESPPEPAPAPKKDDSTDSTPIIFRRRPAAPIHVENVRRPEAARASIRRRPAENHERTPLVKRQYGAAKPNTPSRRGPVNLSERGPMRKVPGRLANNLENAKEHRDQSRLRETPRGDDPLLAGIDNLSFIDPKGMNTFNYPILPSNFP